MREALRTMATVALISLLVASLYVMAVEVWEMWVNKWAFERVYRTLEEAESQKEEEVVDEDWIVRYKALAEENTDFFGWIHIEGADIDYPVMYSPDRPGYYLKHSFWKKWSDYGTPYLDERCVLGISNNLVVYGHNMKNGTMFAQLHRFESKEFWNEHRFIQFDTLAELGIYEIFAVFHFDTNHESYWFNTHTDMGEMEIREFIEEVSVRQLYETGVKTDHEDQLLTLCTCDRTYRDGRFFVIAKKVET